MVPVTTVRRRATKVAPSRTARRVVGDIVVAVIGAIIASPTEALAKVLVAGAMAGMGAHVGDTIANIH